MEAEGGGAVSIGKISNETPIESVIVQESGFGGGWTVALHHGHYTRELLCLNNRRKCVAIAAMIASQTGADLDVRGKVKREK